MAEVKIRQRLQALPPAADSVPAWLGRDKALLGINSKAGVRPSAIPSRRRISGHESGKNAATLKVSHLVRGGFYLEY